MILYKINTVSYLFWHFVQTYNTEQLYGDKGISTIFSYGEQFAVFGWFYSHSDENNQQRETLEIKGEIPVVPGVCQRLIAAAPAAASEPPAHLTHKIKNSLL